MPRLLPQVLFVTLVLSLIATLILRNKFRALSVCAHAFYLRHLRHINKMSRYLPMANKERVVNTIITSRLDYCNSFPYGTSVNNIARLQRIHNSAAREVLRRPWSDSAMPLLSSLAACTTEDRVYTSCIYLQSRPSHQIGLQPGKRLANKAVTQQKPPDHYVVVDSVKGRTEVNQNKCRALSIVHSGFHGICYTQRCCFC